MMMTSARIRYAGYRHPAEIISYAVWLYFRLPLALRMVEELLAARGTMVSHETVRQWASGRSQSRLRLGHGNDLDRALGVCAQAW